ncbi:MAG TPA: hypothetical protein ENN79_08695 [Desulfobacteraceae bacterium]|nr:hypothetical protein [Desulfobacteraceae bacterium]
MRPEEDGPLARTITGRIEWARKMFRIYHETLRADYETGRLSLAFDGARIEALRVSDSIGVSALCRMCDREQGGSCCGAGIELRYDGWLLLVNILLGIELPQNRARPGSCFFLGKADAFLRQGKCCASTTCAGL